MPCLGVENVMTAVDKVDLNSCFAPDLGAARPQKLFEKPGLTTLYLNLPAGKAMHVHEHPGCQVMLVGMVGTANVVVEGVAHTLAAGELLTFSGDTQVEPRNDGTEPCGLLVSLAEFPN